MRWITKCEDDPDLRQENNQEFMNLALPADEHFEVGKLKTSVNFFILCKYLLILNFCLFAPLSKAQRLNTPPPTETLETAVSTHKYLDYHLSCWVSEKNQKIDFTKEYLAQELKGWDLSGEDQIKVHICECNAQLEAREQKAAKTVKPQVDLLPPVKASFKAAERDLEIHKCYQSFNISQDDLEQEKQLPGHCCPEMLSLIRRNAAKKAMQKK
jgi:hypothetical protein